MSQHGAAQLASTRLEYQREPAYIQPVEKTSLTALHRLPGLAQPPAACFFVASPGHTPPHPPQRLPTRLATAPHPLPATVFSRQRTLAANVSAAELLGSAPLSASSSLGSSAPVRRRVRLTPGYVRKQSPRVVCRPVLQVPPPLRAAPRNSTRSYDGSELFEQPASVAEACRSSMGPVSRVQASGEFPVGLGVARPRMHSWTSSAGPGSSSASARPANTDTICFLVGDDLMHAVGRQENVEPKLEEYLSGSPWEGCEDIAHDDLVDWFMEFSHLDASRRTPSLVEALASLLQEEQGKVEDVEEMKEMEDVPNVCVSRSGLLGEFGNVSTASSLRSALLAASGCSSMASPSKSTSQVSKQTSSSLASESEWELEFILRGALDLHGRTESPEVEQGSRRAWSGASKTLEGVPVLNASESAEAEWFAVLTEQTPASSVGTATPPHSSRRLGRWRQEAETAEVDGLIWA